ncbi:hypothetical protein C0993_000499, partial [Termitomyces sp. T159_Od127]
MLLSKVLGVIVIARNGDRSNYYQDPYSYAGSSTETTALGEARVPSSVPPSLLMLTVYPRQAESFQLGSLLRSTYLESSSPSYINGMRTDLVDNDEVKARVKAGVEGT